MPPELFVGKPAKEKSPVGVRPTGLKIIGYQKLNN